MMNTIDHIWKVVYKNDTLEFLHTSVGRVLKDKDNWAYEYHLKDHLGNLRMAVQAGDTTEYLATMEDTAEAKHFQNWQATRENSSLINGHYTSKLNRAEDKTVGLYKQLNVQAGDRIELEVRYELYWFMAAVEGEVTRSAPATVEISLGDDPNSRTEVLGTQNADWAGLYLKRGYMVVLYVDAGGEYMLSSSSAYVLYHPSAWGGGSSILGRFEVVVPVGAVSAQIYLLNETEVDVHFDDFKITHYQDVKIRQEEHYYPFGGGLAGLQKQNNFKFLFTGKEKLDNFDLNFYDFHARQYDYNTGLFINSDPLSHKYYPISNYAYVANNPLKFIDPDGRVVKPADNRALDLIKLSVSREEARYIKTNRDGSINQNKLKKGITKLKTVGDNFQSLVELAKSDVTYNVSFSKTYKTLDENGNTIEKNFNNDKKPYRSENGDLIGFGGITLVPNPVEGEDGSINSEVSIITNSAMNERDQVETFAHEAYGHAYLYNKSLIDKNINPWHKPEYKIGNDSKTGEFYIYPLEMNKDLKQRLNLVQKQALKNYDSRKKK